MKNKKYVAYFSFVLFLFSLPIFANQIYGDSADIVVLSGDIGGTNARLRLSQLKDGEKQVLANKTYKVKDHDGVIEIINLFLKGSKYSAIKSICLAVAAPDLNNPVKLLNSKWVIDIEAIKKTLKIDNVKLINDFEAIGYGIEHLTKDDLYPLQEQGEIFEENGLKVFIGAGTGLGISFASQHDSQYVVYHTEGGHTSFAPADDLQIEILKYLRKKYNIDISAERLLSGSGIVDIYHYYRDINPFNYIENEHLKKNLEDKDKDASKEITTFALMHPDDQMSVKTVETFVKIYGSKTGDVAFSLLPHGGIYVVGNIATNILTNHPFAHIFVKSFRNKDKTSYILKDFPVWVVTSTEVGLQGAENYAFKLILPQVAPAIPKHSDHPHPKL